MATCSSRRGMSSGVMTRVPTLASGLVTPMTRHSPSTTGMLNVPTTDSSAIPPIATPRTRKPIAVSFTGDQRSNHAPSRGPETISGKRRKSTASPASPGEPVSTSTIQIRATEANSSAVSESRLLTVSLPRPGNRPSTDRRHRLRTKPGARSTITAPFRADPRPRSTVLPLDGGPHLPLCSTSPAVLDRLRGLEAGLTGPPIAAGLQVRAHQAAGARVEWTA